MATEVSSLPDARPLVEQMLAEALSRRVSDIHVEPAADGCEIRFRIDGFLKHSNDLSPLPDGQSSRG